MERTRKLLGESTQTYGGINWKIQNIQHKSDTVIIATADIQETVYCGLEKRRKEHGKCQRAVGQCAVYPAPAIRRAQG
ncbi:MAG: hypothetical protein ACLT0Y_00625 [Christensenellales bacterium]